MKARLELILNLLYYAPFSPLSCFLAGWWGGFAILPEKWIPLSAITGLVIGILIDIPIIRRIMKPGDPIPLVYGAVLLVFYAIAMFGFFMGFPVFHFLLSIPASFLVGSYLARKPTSDLEVKKFAFYTALFTSAVYDLVLMASAYVAVINPTTASELQSMLRLPFEISQEYILPLVFFGGMLLLILNFFFTRELTRFFHRYLSHTDN